jgi:signal transduction histidine kinase
VDSHWRAIGEEALRFYGKISASISHEIKNVLAVLNENAGLLEDFTLMAEKGTPLRHDRLKILAQSMKAQIQRADVIVGNMNRFAHSVDESIARVDLNEALDLVVALAGRFADMRSISLELDRREGALPLIIQPFLLENLLWSCLNFVMEASEKGQTIRIVAEKVETGAQVKFSGASVSMETLSSEFQSDQQKAMLAMLGATIALHTDTGEVLLVLPEKIGE